MDGNPNELASTQPSLQPSVSVDWFLQMLVTIVNGTELALPVTLNVGGLLISGEMVSGHKYFEDVAKSFKEGMTDSKIASNLETHFKQLGDIYTKNVQGQEQDEESSKPPPEFIHLRNARVFHPGGTPIPTNRAVWWRGRLEAVDGFILGKLFIS